jgi:hypothetical protein
LIFSPEVSGFATPALTPDLLNASFQFERHPGTDHYLTSLRPFNVEGAFETYGQIVQVWGIVITLYLAGAKGLKTWRERRGETPPKSVGDFMSEILAVEAEAHGSCAHEERIRLDHRLSEIKKTVVELHRAGRLEDAEHFQSLLVALADARSRIWGSASHAPPRDAWTPS